MNQVRVNSNWDVNNGHKLEDLIVIHSTRVKKKDCFAEDINPESCRCLSKRTSDTDSERPVLEIALNKSIKEINVYSEGSLIEIFGKHNDYLFTCEADFVDDWEEFAVYHAKIDLSGLFECKLKFTRIKSPERLWIYSIQVVINDLQLHHYSLFNFDNVQQLLSGSSQQTLQRAEKFKNLYKSYKKNTDFLSNVKVLECLLKAQTLENDLKFNSSSEQETSSSSSSAISQSNDTSNNIASNIEESFNNKDILKLFSNDTEFFKLYVDKQVCDAKEQIIKHIDFKIGELKTDYNAKLEKIINLLENNLKKSNK